MKEAAQRERRLAILGYHKIGPSPVEDWDTWYYIPEAIFVDQLSFLHHSGWQVIDVARLLRGIEEPSTLPHRAALITFDDGYRSLSGAAVRCLTRFGYPAVTFIPTDFIGGYNSFDQHQEPEEPICDWADLRELERCAISVQSHGASHRAFSDLTPEEQMEEAVRSKTILEDGLGKHIEMFAFPYGDGGKDPNAVSRILERAGYSAACLYGGEPMFASVTAPFRLSRVAMGPDTDMAGELAALQEMVP